MCRSPLCSELVHAVLPSEIPVDPSEASIVAAHHPVAYAEGLAREALLERRLAKTLIREVPLVNFPGTCPVDARGNEMALHIKPRTKVTLYFGEGESTKTLNRAASVGRVAVLMGDGTTDGASRGFLAHVSSAAKVRRTGQLRARLICQSEFELVGDVHRDENGCVLGAVSAT